MRSFDVDLFAQLRPQNPLHYFETLGSTMTEGARLAQAGAHHGEIVFAEEQTNGIGRLGRGWISEAAVGIYCSILLHLQLPPAEFPIVSLLLGLATSAAIEKSCAVKCDLRWPNDVLIGDRKVAGILPQLVDHCIVAGIGINVNNMRFAEGLRTPATSLRVASGGKSISREQVLADLLASVDATLDLLQQHGPQSILHAFTRASSYALDRRVVIEDSGAIGTTAGLDENGFLLIRTEGGRIDRIAAGGVRAVAS